MKYLRLTDGIDITLMRSILELAQANVPELAWYPIGEDSPLRGLALAEITEQLGDSLQYVGNPIDIPVSPSKVYRGFVEVIVALDDTNDDRLAGFIQYKPRLPVGNSCSIGYLTVDAEYRGRGVLRGMMELLTQHYPAVGLDCALQLVGLYENLGFKVGKAQGCHVAMETLPLTGSNWNMGEDILNARPSIQRAKEAIRDKLGKNTRQAYEKRDADMRAATAEVAEFLKLHAL
ncbi:GNAT family N-acetyltransferase [Pseudomonas aeruginosa]|nr:GNAT family N-acetyltransferase [Pseudomonas aeruginosa]